MSSQDQDVWETAEKYCERATQVEQQLEQWRHDLSRLKSAEEAHQGERRQLESELQKALEKVRTVAVENPEHQAQFGEAIDEASRCGREAREAAKKQQENHQRVCDHLGRFPLPGNLSPEGAFVTSPQSLHATSLFGEQGGNPPSSDRPAQEVEETTTRTPVSPPCREPSPPVPTGEDVGMAALPELEQHGDEPEAAYEVEGSADEAGTSITVAVNGTADEEFSVIPEAHQELGSKRKAVDQSLSHPSPKRVRHDDRAVDPDETASRKGSEAESEAESEVESEVESEFEAESESEPETEADSGGSTSSNIRHDIPTKRTIQFDEVYGNGNARYKHLIIEYEGKWYIIVCEEHDKHFGDNPLRGAAKHLWSKAHNNDLRTYARAIEMFGIEVLNCDPRRQMMNNDAFRQALHEGYQPRNNPQLPSKRETAAHGRSRDRRNIIDAGISNPTPGEIYLTHVQTSHHLVGVIVLPRNCFGDPSFEDVGLEGSSAESTFLVGKVPGCYRTSPATGHITGWETGYEDGGKQAFRREYPVMYLDSEPASGRIAWLRATSLRVYDQVSWADKPELISNYARLRRFQDHRQSLRTTPRRQVGTARSGEYILRGTGLESSHQSASATVPPSEEPIERPSNGPDKQRSLESNGQRGSPDPSTSSQSASLPDVFVSTSGFRPIESNIVGHATTVGEGLPQHNQAQESRASSGNEPGSLTTGIRRGADSTALRRSYGAEDVAPARYPIASQSVAAPRKKRRWPAGKEARGAVAQERPATTPTPLTDSPRKRVTSKRHPTVEPPTRHQGTLNSMGPPPVVRSNTSTSRPACDQFRSHGTEESPVDIDDIERGFTAITSEPFRRSFEHSTPTARDTSATQPRRPMPNERQIRREQHPRSGATESNDRDRQPMSPRAR